MPINNTLLIGFFYFFLFLDPLAFGVSAPSGAASLFRVEYHYHFTPRRTAVLDTDSHIPTAMGPIIRLIHKATTRLPIQK